MTIATPAACCIGCIVAGIWLFLKMRTAFFGLFALGPPPTTQGAAAIQLALIEQLFWPGILALCLAAGSGYELWKYQRWGRVPRVLSANSEGLILSRLLFWRIRERRWPVHEITAIRIRPVKGNLTPKRWPLAEMFIERGDKRRVRYILSSREAELPDRIARRIAEVLGRPLVTS